MARLNWRMDRLDKLLHTAVEGLGYQYWGLEFVGDKGADILRCYIEGGAGWAGPESKSAITADACSQVSEHVGTLLDVEQPISGNYQLEVSSPGMSRRMFSPHQCEAAVGHMLDIRLHEADAGGRRRLKARLIAVSEQTLQVEVNGEALQCDWVQIDRIRLVPQYSFRRQSAQQDAQQDAQHMDSING